LALTPSPVNVKDKHRAEALAIPEATVTRTATAITAAAADKPRAHGLNDLMASLPLHPNDTPAG
jgi:hypothetical protein